VERAVKGVREASGSHWLQAFGIVDGVGYDSGQGLGSKVEGVNASAFCSVDSIYYHPEIIRLTASGMFGSVSEDAVTVALNAGVDAAKRGAERLTKCVARKLVQQRILEEIPDGDDILSSDPVRVEVCGASTYDDLRSRFDRAVSENDWETILTMCPVRDSGAPSEIVHQLGFRGTEGYEKAVRRMLSENADARKYVRSLFGDLHDRFVHDGTVGRVWRRFVSPVIP